MLEAPKNIIQMLTRKKRILIGIPTILIVGGGLVIADLKLSENQFLLVLFSVIALGSILEIFAAKREEKVKNSLPEEVPLEIMGKSGEVVQDCSPKGKVNIGSEIWNAISEDESNILSGTKIEVINRQGLTLVVQSKSEDAEL